MPKVKIQFCKHGHDVFIHGRTEYGVCNICRLEHQKRYERKNLGRKRDFQWKSRGIFCTEELYKSLYDKQKGTCAVCLRPQVDLKETLCVDHDHKTGKVRGLLCKYCNQALVPLVESKAHLIPLASKYLRGENND